jgi:hypothetical protein
VIHAQPVALRDGVTPTPPGWFALAVGRVGVELRVRLVGSVHLTASGGADVDLSGTRFVQLREDGDDVVLAPWPVRPWLALGVALR